MGKRRPGSPSAGSANGQRQAPGKRRPGFSNGEATKPPRKGLLKQERNGRAQKELDDDEEGYESSTGLIGSVEDGFLSLASKEEELDKVWWNPDVLSCLSRFVGMKGFEHFIAMAERGRIMQSAKQGVREFNTRSFDVFEAVINAYSALVTTTQLLMVPQVLVESGLADYDANMDYSAIDALEEGFSWRPLANDLGLRAVGLDLYLWRSVHEPADAGKSGPKKRGFAAAGGKKQPLARSDALEAIPESDSKYSWLLIRSAAERIMLASTDFNLSARIVCPRRLVAVLKDPEFRRLNEDLVECDVREFSGRAPPPELLISDSHCVVLLVLEEPVLTPSDSSWSLATAEVAGSPPPRPVEDPDSYAPVVVMSLMQHSVELAYSACMKRAMPALEELVFEDGNLEGPAFGEDNLLASFLKPLIDVSMASDTSRTKAAGKQLQERVGPMIRQAYASSFALLRRKRLAELERSQAAWRASESRRRELQVRRAAASRSLEDAAELMDAELFAELAAKGLEQGTLDKAFIEELEEGMYAQLAVLEGPLRRLVALHCDGPARSGLHDLSTDDLDAALVAMRLPEKSPWPKVGQELRIALDGLADLRDGASAVAMHNHSSAASHKVALLRGSAALKFGEAKLLQFEATARSAGARLGEEGNMPLRGVLEDAREAVATAERDQALWACLSSPPWAAEPPWAAGSLELDRVTTEHMSELERRASGASGLALSQLGEALQAALEGGRCALALQEALRTADVSSLEERLGEAYGHGLVGLEVAEQQLGELKEVESALATFRAACAEVAELLDMDAFEALLESARWRPPEQEEEELRSQLASAIADAESELREPLLAALEDLQGAPASARRLRDAVQVSRLPASNPWRVAAATGCQGLEAGDRCRRAAAEAADAARMEGQEQGRIEMRLSALEEAISHCAAHLLQLEQQGQRLEEARLGASPGLRKALEEGQVALKGLRADEALRARLATAPWGLQPLPAEAAARGDLDELRQLADEATIDCLCRVAATLDAALAAGRCARALEQAVQGRDASELAARLKEAEDLELSGLEHALQRLTELEAAAQDRQQQAEALAAEQRRREAEAREAAAQHVAAAASGSWDDSRWTDLGESSNLIFLDLELTAGFYDFDERPRVLEAALVVTDKDLNEKGRGTWVIGGFSKVELEALSAFHQAHFRDTAPSGGPFPPRLEYGGVGNGLFADVLASSQTLDVVEEEMLDLVRTHCPPGACPLAGYSVQCDREVLKLEMPRLYRYVSHQIVDVSSFLRMARLHDSDRVKQWDGRRASRYNHRALNDVEDSIEALRWVKEEYFQN